MVRPMLLDHQKTAMLYMINARLISATDAANIYGVSKCYVNEQLAIQSIQAAPAAKSNQPLLNKDQPMPPALRAVEKVRAEHMSLYPTMDSCHEAIAFIEQQAPLSTPNEVFSALMLYHNSLLAQLDRDGRLK